MSDQTTMNGRRAVARSPAAGVGRNVTGLIHDLISLAELQSQLIAADLREGASKSLLPLGLLVAAILLALGTMPVILLGIGWALINQAGFSQGMAFLLVSVVALLVAAGAAWWGVRKLQSALAVLARSRGELEENIRWIKMVLKHDQAGAQMYRHDI